MAVIVNPTYQTTGDTILAGTTATTENFEFLIDVFDFPIPIISLEADLSEDYVRLDGGSGEHDGLGLFPEPHSEFLAKRNNPTYADRVELLRAKIIQWATNATTDIPWNDKTALENYTAYPRGSIEVIYAHRPNVWFLAILITTDATERENYIQAMREQYDTACDFHGILPSEHYQYNQQRDFAWMIRELAQLAFLEKNGVLTGTGTLYQDYLNTNKAQVLAEMNRNEIMWYRGLGSQIWKDMNGEDDRAGIEWRAASWQQAFVGQSIAYINLLTFDWLSIAEFQSKHWEFRVNNKRTVGLETWWGWWTAEYDYFYFDDAITIYDALPTDDDRDNFDFWQNVQFANQVSDGSQGTQKSQALLNAGWDPDLIPDTTVDGVSMNSALRFDQQLSAHGLYSFIGVTGSEDFTVLCKTQRQERIDRSGASDNLAWRRNYVWRDVTSGASSLEEVANSLNSGEAAVLPTNNLNTLDVQGRYVQESPAGNPSQDWCFSVPYDAVLGVAVGAGAGNGVGAEDSMILRYDAGTNTWSNVRNPFENDQGAQAEMVHFYDSNALDLNTHILYKMPRTTTGEIHSYNVQTGTREVNVFPLPPTDLGGREGGSWNAVHGISWNPIGASGSIYHSNAKDLAKSRVINRFDIATQTWSLTAGELSDLSPRRYTNHHNVATSQNIVCSGDAGAGCYLIDNDEVFQIESPPIDIYERGDFLPHPSAAQSILFGNDGMIYTLDYATGLWDAGVAATGIMTRATAATKVIFPFTADDLDVCVFEAYNGGGNSEVIVYKP